jgi:hypothetical protein
MDANLARFGETIVKNFCNFFATPKQLYRYPGLGCKRTNTCVSKEES